VSAVTTDLRFAGIPASTEPGDERHSMRVLRRIMPDAIRAAGYGAVGVRKSDCADRPDASPTRKVVASSIVATPQTVSRSVPIGLPDQSGRGSGGLPRIKPSRPRALSQLRRG
jgi:hypothetical protein